MKFTVPIKCLLFFLLLFLAYSSGCIAIPSSAPSIENITVPNETNETQTLENITPPFLPTETVTPTPIPTSYVNNTNDLYQSQGPEPRRISVGYENTTEIRKIPHTVYTENGLELNTSSPLGRKFTILHGPFIINYTVHPKVNNPIYAWATLDLRDSWGNFTAGGGYNRHYPASTNQQILVYQTGTYYLKIEGNFVTLDFSLQTTDPVQNTVPTHTPEPEDEE